MEINSPLEIAFIVILSIISIILIIIDQIFPKKIKLFHRCLSISICIIWGLLYPLIHTKLPPWIIGLISLVIIVYACYLWIFDERRQKKNEELFEKQPRYLLHLVQLKMYN